MAEILNKIVAKATGMQYATEDPLVFSSIEITSRPELAFLTEYWVGVELGHSLRIDDSVPNQREEAIKVIRRALTETIFGEFRPLLARAGYAIYNRNFEDARKAIGEIDMRMFA